ncbi:PaaI family thioesterase [Thalassotalea montiporae]
MKHYQQLISMYAAAPINEFYQPTLTIDEGVSEVVIELQPKHLHSAGSAHGSVYFKLLDDAAFFAANSLETEVFVVTTSFTTYITRPISQGKMRAVGKVVNANKSQFIVEAVVFDDQDREVGRGNGLFVRSKNRLVDAKGYSN